jgi:hypothetical protein
MMPILISSGVIAPGQFGPSSRRPSLFLSHPLARRDHVAHRDPLGDADDEVEIGFDRFQYRAGRHPPAERRRPRRSPRSSPSPP